MSFVTEPPKVGEILFHLRSHMPAEVKYLPPLEAEPFYTLEWPSGGTSRYHVEELNDMWTRTPLAAPANLARRTPR